MSARIDLRPFRDSLPSRDVCTANCKLLVLRAGVEGGGGGGLRDGEFEPQELFSLPFPLYEYSCYAFHSFDSSIAVNSQITVKLKCYFKE